MVVGNSGVANSIDISPSSKSSRFCAPATVDTPATVDAPAAVDASGRVGGSGRLYDGSGRLGPVRWDWLGMFDITVDASGGRWCEGMGSRDRVDGGLDDAATLLCTGVRGWRGCRLIGLLRELGRECVRGGVDAMTCAKDGVGYAVEGMCEGAKDMAPKAKDGVP